MGATYTNESVLSLPFRLSDSKKYYTIRLARNSALRPTTEYLLQALSVNASSGFWSW